MTTVLARSAAVVACSAVLVSGQAMAAPTRPDVGSPGIGDPYFPTYGNGGYNVRHYALDLRYEMRTGRLVGTATLRAITTQRLTRFNLDLMLRARSVRVDGQPARFAQPVRHELVVWPQRRLAADQPMRVVVRYAGRPERVDARGDRPWLSPGLAAFVNGSPEGATVWFPVNDHPADPAAYDVVVHTRPGWEGVSAGTLVSHRRRPSESVWHWRVRRPMTSDESFLGIGQYRFIRGESPTGLPYSYAISTGLSPDLTAKVRSTLRRSPATVRWMGRHVGRYPYRRVGGTVPGPYDAATIASPSAPVYTKWLFRQPERGQLFVVHELAHQWFGNSVMIRRWHNLWLSEGFATWMEWLWSARHGGESLNEQMLDMYRLFPPRNDWWHITTGRPQKTRDLFRTVYFRGAMTVQALRNVVGPRDFRRIVRTWVREYDRATTRAFVDLAERISGRSLRRLFRVWLFTPERPEPTVANGFPPVRGAGATSGSRR